MADRELSKNAKQRYRKSVIRQCKVCGSNFRIFQAWLRHGRGGLFCSRKCSDAGRQRKERTVFQRTCEECGTKFSKRKGSPGTWQFCSRKCRAVACGRRLRGENHPLWKGGVSKRTYASRMAVKDAIREVGHCERCGTTKNLHGHHVRLYSQFAEGRADRSNIEVLCAACHATEHPELSGMLTVQPQRRGVYKNCLACGKQFYAAPYRASSAMYCSHECLFLQPPATRKSQQRHGVYKDCIACGDRFYAKPYRASRALYCSHECLFSHPPTKRNVRNGREVDQRSDPTQRCFAPGASCAGRPENPCQENGKSQTLREPAYPQDGWSREDTEELPR